MKKVSSKTLIILAVLVIVAFVGWQMFGNKAKALLGIGPSSSVSPTITPGTVQSATPANALAQLSNVVPLPVPFTSADTTS
jgi:hypothetical protein